MQTVESAYGEQRTLFALRMSNGTTDNMAIDGSVTEQVFKIAPPDGQVWRIAEWSIYIEDEKGFNVTSYGSNGVLPNGMELRFKQANDTNNLLAFPIKTNGDIAGVTYNVDLHTWGNDNDVLTAQWKVLDAGQYMRLRGKTGDELQVAIRDDMTFLAKQYILVKGYIE